MRLLVGLTIVIAAARAAGWVFGRLRQPPVVGEMIAGILLGPSLVGRFAPAISQSIFTPDALRAFGIIGQVGVGLFIFLVAVDLDTSLLRKRSGAAVAVSHASILVPFFLGYAFANLLYPRLAGPHVRFVGFGMFVGVAMAVTAFPVLARILRDHHLEDTALGVLALTVASVDDVTAWTLLAFVAGVVRSSLSEAATVIGWTSVYITVMLFIVRPAVRACCVRYNRADRWSVGAALSIGLASAAIADAIGIHAIFGAFLGGLVMPRLAALRTELRRRLGPVTAAFLPVYFAVTGLRTQIGLVDTWMEWGICAALITLAIAGKFGGTCLGARLADVPWRMALPLGILMNTRGLMELVVLNVGLDLGVISPRLFAMMVVMALATTLITSPLLAWSTAFATPTDIREDVGADEHLAEPEVIGRR